MKKFLLLAAVVAFVASADAQTGVPSVTAAEYFIGTDPGAGLATPLPLVTSSSIVGVSDEVSINVSGLNAGTYTVGVRFKDATGQWGNPVYQRFTVYPSDYQGFLPGPEEPSATLSAAEYFLGTDPGGGNGTPLTLAEAGRITSETTELPIDISSLAAGSYSVGVRFKSADGVWGNPVYQRFTVYPDNYELATPAAPADANPLQVVAAEYFMGNDPGAGRGTQIPIATAALVGTIENVDVPIASLRQGTYQVGVRFKSANGTWGNPTYTRFTIYDFENAPDNRAPSALYLTSSSFNEGVASGTVVSALSTDDPDGDTTFTYALVPGEGSSNNGLFTLQGSLLNTAAAVDYEMLANKNLSIRVKTTDAGGLSLEQVFTVTVLNVTTDDDDGDELTEAEEQALGTNPLLADTDGDGVDDKAESLAGTDPNDPSAYPDSQSPLITLIGVNPMDIFKGSAFTDPGATVTDNKDATRSITGSGTVDASSVGIYTLTYTATDAAGNLGLPVTRTVNVGLDPAADEDGDGLSNAQELTLGTSPYQKDTDADGVNDPVEVADGTNPSDATSYNNLNKGLVAYYPFNGNTNDDSGNALHATNEGAVLQSDRFGALNRALYFDGVSARVNAGDRSAFNFGASNFTLSAWIKPEADSLLRYILSKYRNPDPNSYGIGTAGGSVNAYAFIVDQHPATAISGSVGMADGGYHQMLVTYTRGGLMRVYLDGVERDSADISGEPGLMENNQPLLIGSLANGSGYGLQAFHGVIDDVRIYNRALSSEEVGQLYQYEAPPLEDSEPPIITLNGADPLEIYKGSTFTDPGATVTDNVDAVRTITGSGTVDASTVGIYTLTYTTTDAAGNMALPVTRTLNVVMETTRITLTDIRTISVPGASMTHIQAASDTHAVGTYRGSDGNPHAFLQTLLNGARQDLYVPGNELPGWPQWSQGTDIVGNSVYFDTAWRFGYLYNLLSGQMTKLHPNEYPGHGDAGITSVDPLNPERYVGHYDDGGDIVNSFYTDGSSFTQLKAPGTSQCWAKGTYGGSVVGSGNNGSGWYWNGSSYLEGGIRLPESFGVFTSYDVTDIYGDHIVGNALSGNNSRAFLYQISTGTYRLLEWPGGGSVCITSLQGERVTGSYWGANGTVQGFIARIPGILVDSTAPVITLIGSNPLEIYKDSVFTDPGATVTDNVDAARTVFGVGTIDTTTIGIYELTYTATDAAGNMALPVTRTVNVVLDPAADEDGDGLGNAQELTLGTSPYQKDTDADGVNDPVEVADGTNPTDSSSYNGLSRGLVAYFPLDGNAQNSFGSNGINYGATLTEDRFGNANGALNFNGINQYVDCGPMIPNYENATLSVWALVDPACPPESGILAKPRFTWGTGLEIRANCGSYGVTVGFNNWLDNLGLTHPSSIQNVNQWHHYAVTTDGRFLTYFVDGVKVGEQPFLFQNVSSSYNVVIGAGTSGDHSPANYTYFAGLIDDVRIYSRALSEAEVLSLFRREIGPKPVINLLGANPIEIYKGTPFIDSGATVVDDKDSGLSVVVSGTVNSGVVGSYTLTYSATDSDGHEATPVTRTVNVVDSWPDDPRNLLPSFTNYGFDLGTFEQWSIRHDRTPWSFLIKNDPLAEGGKAMFFEEWALGVCIVSPNFTAVAGSYYEARFYRPRNISSCKAIVIAGSTPTDINIPLGHDHLAEVSVSSSTGYVTTQIDLTPFAGQVIRVGFFGGNLQADYAKVFAPISSPDIQAPVITLIGDNPKEILKGSLFTDPGATVTDNVDPTRTITGSGTVDTGTVGVYTLTYTAQDAAGNLALPVERTVNVVLDPAADEDGDGLSNAQELTLGTSPYQKDTDADGVNDPVELADGTNPSDANSYNNLNKGLVAYYPFNGNAKDESGNGRNGVPQNTSLVTDRKGQLNGAYTFNKTSGRIVADYVGWPGGNSDRTVSLWVKCDSIMHGNLFTFGDGTQTRVNTRFSLQLASDGIAFIGESNDSGKYWPGDLNGAGWHQLAITWQGGVGRIFLDGAVLGEFSKTLNTDGSMPLVIGSNSLTRNDEFFEGLLDDVRVYNRALSYIEINGLYISESLGRPVFSGDRIYTIVPGVSWSQAESNAVKLGGHLVAINTEQENEFLWQEFSNPQKYRIRANQEDYPNVFSHWIGLTDQEQEGLWKWSSGEPLAFQPPTWGILEGTVRLDENWARVCWNVPASWISGYETHGFWQDHNLTGYQNGNETPTGIAEIPFVRRGNSAYVVVYGPTWGDAEARAVQLGGHLVKIDNAEENEFLVSTFQPTLGNYGFWIGATDQETEGVWKWSDGNPVSYTNWGPSEPNNTYVDGGEEDHGQIVYPINGNPGYGSVGRWNDTRESTADRPIGGWPYTTAGIAEIPLTSPDTEVPVITLIGDNPMDIYKGSGFNDPSATVTDNVDVARTITGSGSVDTGTVGFYTVTYTATDAAGNLALPVTRTVNVVLDPVADEDGDGLSNAQELTLGTSPYQKDTDTDGVNDPVEVVDGTNPNDASSYNNLNKGLVAYYPLDGNMLDASGNNRHGIRQGGAFGENRQGESAKALSFSAAAQYGRIPVGSDLLSGDFTLSAWVNFSSFANNYPTIFEGENHYLNLHGLGPIYGADLGKIVYYDQSAPQSPRGTIVTSSAVQESKWISVQLVKDGQKLSLYINGTLSQEFQGVSGVIQAGSHINLGNQNSFGRINNPNDSECTLFGALDDIRVYNRAFSVDEAFALYKREMGPNPVISLLGANPIEIYKGTPFSDPGATVVDDKDSGLSVLVSGTVDSSTLGSYTLTYSATDSDGNEGTPVTRTVNVVLDPNADEDGDGIPNATELTYGTSPTNADTDGDALNDGYEMGYGRYELVTGSFTWDQARLDAEARGGHLLTVSNAQEWQMVQDRLGAAMPLENYWMGGTDALSEGNWMWVTGEAWNYSNWAGGGYWQSDWWRGHWWGGWWVTTYSEPDGGTVENHLTGRMNSGWNSALGWGSADGNSSKPSYILEFGAYSNATLADTDGDGANDGQEIQAGSDPNDSLDTPTLRATPYAGLDVSEESQLWSFGGPSWTTRLGWSSHDQLDTAVSRSADGQTSWMERTVEGPAYVSFWWRGSSESYYDFYSYTVDGVVQERYSGERGWQRVSLFLASGSHTVRWSYEKDESESSGEDAVYVDELSVIPASSNLEVSQGGGPVSSPWNIDFGAVLEGSPFVDRILTLSNQGNLGMEIELSLIPDCGFQLLDAPTYLEANQSVNMTVRMLTSSPGLKSTFLSILAPESATPAPLIELTGTVLPKIPVMELTQGGAPVSSGLTFPLGNLPQSIEFTMRNLGTAPLRPVVSVLSGEVSILAGSVTELAPGEFGTLTLYFAPSTTGVKTAVISLLTNDANHPDTRITLTGTSVLPNSGARSVTLGQTGGGTGWQVGSGGELTVTGGANNSQSYLEATYQGPGLLSWCWKTQTQAGNDSLSCTVNGFEMANISKKNGSWENQLATLPEGVCTVRWNYQKDGIPWTGSDSVWLSSIQYRAFEGLRQNWQQWLFSTGLSSGAGSTYLRGGLPALLAFLGGVDPYQGPQNGEYQPILGDGVFKYRYGVSKGVSGNLTQRPVFATEIGSWGTRGFTQQVISEDANRIVVEISAPTGGLPKGFYRLDAVGTLPQN